jgi:hypothetical protein
VNLLESILNQWLVNTRRLPGRISVSSVFFAACCAAELQISLEGGLRCVQRDALGLSGFRVSESLSSWMTVAGGWASTFFDLGRLISRQKGARATARVMWSTSAISFQSNPLRCAPNMIRLS